MTQWACQEFGFANFEPLDLYITFQSNYYRSKGGRGLRDGQQHAVIAMHLYQFTVARSRGHFEYSSFGGDLEIGSFISDDWRLHLDALIAHETSHAIQHLLPYWPNRYQVSGKASRFGDLGTWEGGHGEFFQNIYRKIRREFINPRLEFYQLGCPGQDFEIYSNVSQIAGERIVGEDNNIYEIIGLRPRARVQVYWIQNVKTHDIFTLSAQELYDWWPSLIEGIHLDGFLPITKMAA